MSPAPRRSPAAPKAVRIIDIAKEVGVSSRVVSKVLFPNTGNSAGVSARTAERVKEVAKRLGYLPNLTARQLAGENPRMIGALVAPFAANIYYNILAMLEEQAAKHDYRLIVAQVHTETTVLKRFIADFAGRKMDGVVCFVHENFEITPEFREICQWVPNTVFVGPPQITWADWISADLAEGVRMIVRHLHENGRRRIALFQPKNEMAPFQERIRGFKSILKTLRLPAGDCPIWRYSDSNEDRQPFFARHLNELLAAHPNLDAIVTINDVAAMYVMQYCHRRKISVPGTISVTGFDNSVMADASTPPITSLSQQPEVIAKMVIDTLLARTNDPGRPQQAVLIPPILYPRESTLCQEAETL